MIAAIFAIAFVSTAMSITIATVAIRRRRATHRLDRSRVSEYMHV